jgi:hypothetical protein
MESVSLPAGVIREQRRAMNPLCLVVSTFLAVTLCFTSSATAQPAPAPAAAPAAITSPEAEPPAPTPEAPRAAERGPPAPTALPAPTAPPARGAPRVASPFGVPSQLEPASPVPARPESQPGSQPIKGRRISEGAAISLSLAGTLGSWVLFGLAVGGEHKTGAVLGLAGMIVGPNLGHWYQGTVVTRGTGLRVIGTASTIYGFLRMTGCEGNCYGWTDLFLYGGALLFIGATVDDLIDAPHRAWKHNQRLKVVGITPMVTDRSAGFAIGGQF